MIFCATKTGHTLDLGRDGSTIIEPSYVSKFRKDQTQKYEFKNFEIYGRELVDTSFVSIRYDIAKKYDNYKLKNIIAQEGLEKPGRTFYDASTIRVNYTNPEELVKIKAYAEEDADDALALFDLMIPTTFYSSQMIPKAFQQTVNSATGSQINSMMVRAYLQEGHSIPKADEAGAFQGAISYGQPGIYKWSKKWDVSSLYPSVIIAHNIENRKKDPKGYFQMMVRELTAGRLRDKQLAKETGDRKYKDSEQSKKVYINSFYGFLGTRGLNFNYPEGANQITGHGRDILKRAILWATGEDFKHEVEYVPEED
jgi:DNA polymerase, archaea type